MTSEAARRARRRKWAVRPAIALYRMLPRSSSSAPTAHSAVGDRWRRTCTGILAECMEEAGDEFALSSESDRRILKQATSSPNYISYRALDANTVPCSRAGNSYYSNCQPGAPANPYHRHCNTIDRCARAA